MEKLKRYIVFLIGLFINSLGVSLITKADLGTSPISSIPYVLSLNFPFAFLGQFTIVFSLLLIVIQLIILRRNFKPEHLLQIPISILFGYFIDLTMVMLFFVHPGNYLSSPAYLLVGCVILGFGCIQKYWRMWLCFQGNLLSGLFHLPGRRNSGQQRLHLMCR